MCERLSHSQLCGDTRHTTLQIDRVPDASHWIVHEQPGRVAELIISLLD